jgi:hypothetical protein
MDLAIASICAESRPALEQSTRSAHSASDAIGACISP